MKRNGLNTIAATAGLAVLAQYGAVGADSEQSQSQSGQSGKRKKTSWTQKLRGSKAKDAKVTSKNGEEIGQVEDLIIDPQTGQVQFVILTPMAGGGGGGGGQNSTPIPWAAIT